MNARGDSMTPANAVSRRGFLFASAGLIVAAPVLLGAQAPPQPSMQGDGYVPVRLPPKEGAEPSMTPTERDAFERRLACPCPCTMDIFTCRTSMPSCSFSPRIHRDVMTLVEGGYTADEIMAAFHDAYGEYIRMSPTKRGFNLLAWTAPFAAVGGGALALFALLRRWQRSDAAPAEVTPLQVSATPEELARLEAAVRGDDR